MRQRLFEQLRIREGMAEDSLGVLDRLILHGYELSKDKSGLSGAAEPGSDAPRFSTAASWGKLSLLRRIVNCADAR
jgi:hypothetical protein